MSGVGHSRCWAQCRAGAKWGLPRPDLLLAREAGFDRYFTKPVDPDTLLLMLAEAAANRVGTEI